MKMGRFDDAIRDCREAIKLEPTYVLAYYRLGCVYYDQGRNIEVICEGFVKGWYRTYRYEKFLN